MLSIKDTQAGSFAKQKPMWEPISGEIWVRIWICTLSAMLELLIPVRSGWNLSVSCFSASSVMASKTRSWLQNKQKQKKKTDNDTRYHYKASLHGTFLINTWIQHLSLKEKNGDWECHFIETDEEKYDDKQLLMSAEQFITVSWSNTSLISKL